MKGATQEELTKVAVEVLLACGRADRVGVWMDFEESRDAVSQEPMALLTLRGMVADQDGHATPAEWTKLTPEVHLPQELLTGGKIVEENLYENANRPVIGPLLEMRRALWAPIEQGRHLRGVLFAGARSKSATLPRCLFESVAGELSLALELKDQRRIAGARHLDLAEAWRMLALPENSQALDAILTNLAQSCTETDSQGSGLGALFAVIGRVQSRAPLPERSAGPAEKGSEPRHPAPEAIPDVQFSWRGGDPRWTRAVDSEPVAKVWRRALQAHRTSGSDVRVSWSTGGATRIVAVPLQASGETLGVLVAGVRHADASLMTLERLELRAALAASALLRQKRHEETSQEIAWMKEVLQASSIAAILVDSAGKTAGLTLGARALLGESSPSLPRGSQENGARSWLELFSPREAPRLSAWLRKPLIRYGTQNTACKILSRHSRATACTFVCAPSRRPRGLRRMRTSRSCWKRQNRVPPAPTAKAAPPSF
jgi:hypothetical protein